MESPLSESSISLKLEEIQRRCSELMEAPEGLAELTLEEAIAEPESGDPYNRR